LEPAAQAERRPGQGADLEAADTLVPAEDRSGEVDILEVEAVGTQEVDPVAEAAEATGEYRCGLFLLAADIARNGFSDSDVVIRC